MQLSHVGWFREHNRHGYKTYYAYMNKGLSQLKAKKIIIIPIVIVIVFFTIQTILLYQPSTEIDYTVKHENLVDTILVSGTYMTASQVPVNSPASGTIISLYVENGDRVKKGDPLFYVESTATTDEQDAAYSNYESALSGLQTAQNTIQSLDAAMWTKQQAYIYAQNTQNYMNNNTTNPVTKNAYTDLEKFAINSSVTQAQKDFQAAEQAYKTAGAAVNAGQAEVAQTKHLYEETQSTTVTAPGAGIIVNFNTKVGDSVSEGNAGMVTAGSSAGQTSISSSAPQPILVIANLSDPHLTAAVSEDYAAWIMAGQKVSIVFDSLKSKTFSGMVQNIDTVGTDTDGVITYNARITADNITSNIKPDMTALITIETLRKNNVIDVPNSAIITTNGRSLVEDAKTRRQIPVTLGVNGMAKTEVTGGLRDGVIIVANP